MLLAGDLTKRGELAEADVLADEVRGLPVPIVAVLGNHDYESDQERVLTQRLLDVGVRILEGSATVLEIDKVRLGIAGGKGFAGGFAGACATAFGEREMKLFANASLLAASAMESALTSLDADVRVLLTHYAPIRGTLHGEDPELYPMLGSYLYAELADGARSTCWSTECARRDREGVHAGRHPRPQRGAAGVAQTVRGVRGRARPARGTRRGRWRAEAPVG